MNSRHTAKKLFTRFAGSEKWQRFGFALLFAILIALFIKIPIERFSIQWQQGHDANPSIKGFFLANDLDSDGNSERIYLYRMPDADRFVIMLYDNSGNIINTLSMINHEWTPFASPGVYDINNDGINEIVVITHRNDSVLLNAINLINLDFLIRDFFIGTIERPQPQMAHSAVFYAFEDFNHDGQKELYFKVDAGYGLKPRGLFRLDVDSLNLYQTPESYIVWDLPYFHDTDKDGIPEIFPFNYAPMNVHFETDYPDTRTWLTYFDLELNYRFDPIPMHEGYGNLFTLPVKGLDTLFYALSLHTNNKVDYNEMLVVTTKGEIVNRKQVFKGDPSLYMQKLDRMDGKDYLIINNIGRFELSPELKDLPRQLQVKQKNYKPWWIEKSWLVDADGDGNPERIYYNDRHSTIEIVNEHKNFTTSILLSTERQLISGIFPYFIAGKVEKLMVSGNLGFFFLDYDPNPFYPVKYVIWLVIFMGFWLFIFLIQWLQRKRMEQKWATERQLIELQFSTIRNQLNPHFIFNSLTALGYLIENGKKEEAYDFLSLNARLIRRVVDDADLTTRSLGNEITFVKEYLLIQKLRFGEKLLFQFDIDNNVDLSFAVPRMVIHTYVENAIKHGFHNLKKVGLLEIKISFNEKVLTIKIKDNGSGFKSDHLESSGGGKGMEIMQKYYRLLEKQLGCRIDTAIKDLNGLAIEAEGTEIIITIDYNAKS